MPFDEEADARIEEMVDEFYEALVTDQTIRFWEGGIVRSVPVGAPPEYITVEIEGINDQSVMWRGYPGGLSVTDRVLVWENPITHRREIWGSSGTFASSPFVHDHSSVTQGGDPIHLHAYGSIGGAIFWDYNGVGAGAQTVIPGGAGDVTKLLWGNAVVAEVTGAGTAGQMVWLAPGGSQAIYTDGVDTLTLAVGAGGDVTVQRTAGADTFQVVLWLIWI